MSPNLSPVVINDLDIVCSSPGPTEADAELVVDSNAVLPLPISLQSFKSIPRWQTKIAYVRRRVNLIKLAEGSAPKGPGASPPRCRGVLPIEDILSAAISEAPDHLTIIARISCYRKGNPKAPLANGLELSGAAQLHRT